MIKYLYLINNNKYLYLSQFYPNQLLHTSTLRGGGMYISELFLFTLDTSCVFIIHQSGVDLRHQLMLTGG